MPYSSDGRAHPAERLITVGRGEDGGSMPPAATMENKKRCPTCGATLDSAVIYPDGEAFCMECGEVFIIKDYER